MAPEPAAAIDPAAFSTLEKSVGVATLVEILQCYIVTAEQLTNALAEACAEEKWDDAARLAQDIVGAAGGLGLSAITQAARTFAHAAREGKDRHDLRNAADLGLAPASHPELLVHEKEGELLRALAEFPRVVAAAAQLREPHRVARYLEDTAASYHRFYDNCRVLPRGDEEPTDLHAARLQLVAATRIVLANGLELLGVSAPERM